MSHSAAVPAPLPTHSATVKPLIEQHRHQRGALLPLLHAVQDALGHVPPGSVPAIAAALNLSRAEVHGVISFYHHFRTAPAGRHTVQLCQAEACQACGSEALMAQAAQALGCAPHHTRDDGAVTLAPVYCLGLCASAPALQIDQRLHARVTPQRLQALLAGLEGGA